jgi:predicted permease
MLFIVTPLMMALGGTVRSNPAKLAEGIARQIFFNPLIVATAIGFVIAGSGVKLPGAVNALLSLVGGAAAPGALFVLGLNLTLRPVGRIAAEVPILIAVKLLAHPLIVYLLLSWVGGFDSVWLHTAVLIAALPPAANMLVLAHEYRVYGERAAVALLLGTAASMVTVTIIVIALLRDVLPLDPFR